MPEKFTYLAINLGAFVVPFLFSFHPKLKFYKKWRAFLPAMLATAAFFIVWDAIFTQWGVWNFNPQYILGIKFFSLPIEECLFFFFIPYACVFTYHCFKILIKENFFLRFEKEISWGIIFLLTLVGILNLGKLYTSVTFFFTAIFLFLHVKIFRSKYLGRFFFTYLILLIPFFIVNGMLTGSWIGREVVRYNDAENLGIRLLTIPVEDIIYGMLLILMNITIYEAIEAKEISAKITHEAPARPVLPV